eukprot:5678496-Pyramimonas_sp.AAC.1
MTYHDAGKVQTCKCEEDEKGGAVGGLFEAEVQPGRHEEHVQVQVKEEGGPCGGLVLRHRREEGDVLLR